jgi:very-short-patch-repair endonuclease
VTAEPTALDQGPTSARRDDEGRRRVRRVFSFLRAFAERREPNVRSLAEVQRKLRIRDLPRHASIKVGAVTLRGERTAGGSRGITSSIFDEEDSRLNEPLLRVRRPNLTKAPSPPDLLADWVAKGWERPDGKVAVWNMRTRRVRGSKVGPERFADDPNRTRAFAAWTRTWNRWAEEERPAREAMRVFEALYALHSDIEREGERIELVLGDGRLLWNTPEGRIDHPVLLQRVDLVFDPNIPEFRVVDSDRAAELAGPLLLAGGTLSGDKLNELQEELETGGYHPLAGDETSVFLRRLVSLLGPTGVLRPDVDESSEHQGPVIVRDAWLMVRDRAAGFSEACDRVLEDLERDQDLPPALTRIVGVEPRPGSWGDQTATQDLLLSKLANAEQIEIARALARHGAVLVQGPPGTGKSHTIANLVGHLVAHGKRVLVTSYTTKALRVLREQIVEELRPLCVSVLDNDLEGRAQMEQAVRGIVHRLSTSTDERLAAELDSLTKERRQLSDEVERLTRELRAARDAEYVPVKLPGGEEVTPADAARLVGEQAHRLGWLPAPIPADLPVPLTEAELRELYASNDIVSADEEQQLGGRLPEPAELPHPSELRADIELIKGKKKVETGRYWRRAPLQGDASALANAKRAVEQLAGAIAALTPWQRQIVAAGHAGGMEEGLWRQLADQVRAAHSLWQEAKLLLLENAPTIDPKVPRQGLSAVFAELHARVTSHRSLSGLTTLFKVNWRTVLEGCRVNGQPPREPDHFAALAALAEVEAARADLALRWTRQAEPTGLPAFSALPDPPEPVLAEYVQQFERLLGLWSERWAQTEPLLYALGLNWPAFRADEIARSTPSAPFENDLNIAAGALRTALDERLQGVGRLDALRKLKALAEGLGAWKLGVCQALRTAVNELDPHAYEREHRRLEELWRKTAVLKRRHELLAKVGQTAPQWAAAVERRRGIHGAPMAPRDLAAAWRWRQLEQELDRRAELDDRSLAGRLEAKQQQLREVTIELVDHAAWLAQLRRTGLEARQALIGWADTQRKIGKGTGKRAPALQRKARELLTRAREAVPVWIMPLNRVAESFDARHAKFDVVIVDEASQCDLLGLLALSLGQGAVIVGDHEQVSPSAIGETVEDTQALISQYLGGIPNSHLYDGQTSVYDLARQSFGGTIGLREHFRCVPDIIEFSNQLSYNGEIRPLRDPNAARRPHLVEYQVPPVLEPARRGKINDAEAKVVAALAAAAMTLPEYEGKTFGAISLLGDEQAGRIQELIQQLTPLADLDRRRFVSGNPAQFQGDERDVVFLSMVDVSDGHVLPMQERLSFKQRYNVGASRARDQLWLVHCLEPNRDLQAGDLRRRLIEHVRNPSQRTASPGLRPRAQSPFEADVTERLRGMGFGIEPLVDIGGHRIDIVVSDGQRHVAIACEGDRLKSPERIAEDMARQAVLERVGWRFIQVRATRFFRDKDGVMDSVARELKRLGVEPQTEPAAAASGDTTGENLRNKVVRRAWQLMREQEWVSAEPEEAAAPADNLAPLEAATPAAPEPYEDLLPEETTEPGFVILEQWEDLGPEKA